MLPMYLLPILVCLEMLGPLPVTAVVGGAMANARPGKKDEVKKPVPASFAKDVQPLIAKYCYGCHGNGKSSGSIVLDKHKDEEAVQKNLKTWEKVADNLRSGNMPPDGKPRPNL